MKFAIRVALAWGALCLFAAASAQTFPSRPVHLVVPFPPGGTADELPRLISEKMSANLGVPVIVENRPGASGTIGGDYVARSEPDGYTLLVVPINFFFSQLLYKVSFDPSKFVGVSILASYPTVLLANPKLPASNVPELLALIREKGRKLSYASAGPGTNQHLSAEMFKSLANVDIMHVPYRGTAPAIADVMAGHVDIMFDNLVTASSYVQSGRIKLLGIGSAARDGQYPDVPAIAEALPGYQSDSWMSIAAPPGTPANVVERLNAAVVQALRTPEVEQQIRKWQAQPVGNTPAQMAEVVQRDVAKWTQIIRAANIQPE